MKLELKKSKVGNPGASKASAGKAKGNTTKGKGGGTGTTLFGLQLGGKRDRDTGPRSVAARKARKTIIAGVALLAVSVLIPGRWAWNQRNGLLDEVEAVRSETASVQAQVQQARIIEANRAEADAQFAAITTAMPPKENLPQILDVLTELAATTGVQWESADPAKPTSTAGAEGAAPAPPPPAGDGVGAPGVVMPGAAGSVGGAPAESGASRTLAVQISIIGPPEAVFTYIAALRDLERLLTVDSVDLIWERTPVGEDGTVLPDRLDAAISLRAFVWSPPFAAPAAATPAAAP